MKRPLVVQAKDFRDQDVASALSEVQETAL